MDGVGQDERARPRCHFRPDDRLAEAQFAEHGCHVDPTGEANDRENWLRAGGNYTLGHRSLCLLTVSHTHTHNSVPVRGNQVSRVSYIDQQSSASHLKYSQLTETEK